MSTMPTSKAKKINDPHRAQRQCVALAAGGVTTWSLDFSKRLMRLDEHGVAFFGLDADASRDVELDIFLQVFGAQDRLAWASALQRAARPTDGVFHCECRIATHESPVRWIIARGHLLCDLQGQPASLDGVFIDITERKLVEDRLQSAERRQRSLVDQLPVACYTMDADGLLTHFNSAAAQLWGRTPILGEDMWCGSYRMSTLDGTPLPLEACPAAMALNERRTVRGIEAYVIRPDGSRRWVIPHPDPIYADDGTFLGVINVLVDVTDEREAQHSLRSSEAFLQSIIGASNDCVKVLDLEGRLVWMNEIGMRLIGVTDFSTIELASWPALWVDPVTRQQASEALAMARAKQVGHVCGAFAGGSPTMRWWDVVVSPIFDAHGQVKRLLCVSRDITGQRETEERLASNVQELARSNRDLEQFASIASHDLQEPLRTLSCYLDLLHTRFASDLSETGLRYLSHSLAASLRMRGLLDALLEFGRVGGCQVAFTEISLQKVVSDALEALRCKIVESNARIEVESLPMVRGDGALLALLLQNLLGNGIKFHLPGIPPHVRVDAITDTHNWCHLRISDKGIGIEAQFFTKIFCIFSRLHPQDLYAGSGVGLATCRRIVERHNGRIEVESIAGQGSTFHIFLPH